MIFLYICAGIHSDRRPGGVGLNEYPLTEIERKLIDLGRNPIEIKRKPIDLARSPIEIKRKSIDLERIPIEIKRKIN